MKMWFKNMYLKAVAFVLSLIPKKDLPVVVPPDQVSTAITQQELDNVIKIVNQVRQALASPLAVLVTDLIPTTIDNTIRIALVNGLPVLLAGLMFAKEVLGGKDQQAAMDELLAKVKFSDKADQDALWHALASRLLLILSDGRVTWSEAVQIIEYYYKNGYGTPVAA
jgi:hypothetical protein